MLSTLCPVWRVFLIYAGLSCRYPFIMLVINKLRGVDWVLAMLAARLNIAHFLKANRTPEIPRYA